MGGISARPSASMTKHRLLREVQEPVGNAPEHLLGRRVQQRVRASNLVDEGAVSCSNASRSASLSLKFQ
jgi:hypothetical protein